MRRGGTGRDVPSPHQVRVSVRQALSCCSAAAAAQPAAEGVGTAALHVAVAGGLGAAVKAALRIDLPQVASRPRPRGGGGL